MNSLATTSRGVIDASLRSCNVSAKALRVEGSISKHPAVKVYEEIDVLKVSVSGTTVLSVRATADNSAEVDELDLRPLGLNLHGDSSTLMAGTSKFSGNSMSGGGILIGFGG